MLSAEVFALVKVAVGICNAPDMKRKILYDIQEDINHKQHLNKIFKEKEEALKSDLCLQDNLQEKLMSMLFSVATRMLNWSIYHKRTVELSQEFIVNFLNSSYFTQRGIIDNTKAAEELMICKTLSIVQKYKIACIYCFIDYIPVLFTHISHGDKGKIYNYAPGSNVFRPQQTLVRFWSHYLVNDIKVLTRGRHIDRYILIEAVKSGSVAAVQFCLEDTNLRLANDALVNVAEQAVKNRTSLIEYDSRDYALMQIGSKCLWVPGDYYIDILYFAFSKMTEDQKIKFLEKDIKGLIYEKQMNEDDRRCRTLEYFLNWPYQNYFMKAARLVWNVLPESNYAVVLLRICDKIESYDKYGDHKFYNYIKLLKEFWCESPERYKRYVLSNAEVTYIGYDIVKCKTGVKLLKKLISIKRITHEYREILEMILCTGTSEEKERIIYSTEWTNKCMRLIRKEKWIRLDEFVHKLLFTESQANKFKRKLINMELIQDILIYFVTYYKGDTGDLLLKWGNLTEEEIILFKRDLIYSRKGIVIIKDFIYDEECIDDANNFCEWGLSSQEEITKFKTAILASETTHYECRFLVTSFKIGLLDKFINWLSSDQSNIQEFKNKFVKLVGFDICKDLMTEDEPVIPPDEPIDFKNDRLKEVAKFLSWCFSSEGEKYRFKKELFKKCGENIHFKLISDNKYEEASIFFKWFHLSEKQIRKLKRETVFSAAIMERIHRDMHNNMEFYTEDHMYNKWENIYFFLDWCLQNEETFREFKSKYDELYGVKSYESKGEIIPKGEEIKLNKFYSVFDEELRQVQTRGTTERRTKMQDSPTKSIPHLFNMQHNC